MILVISRFIANLFGLDLQKVQKWVIVAVMGLIVLVVLIAGLWLRSCLSRTPKLDEKQIQAAQKAIAEQDRKKMTEILAESDAKVERIDANLANAETEKLKVLSESRKKYNEMSTDELARELEARK